MYIIISRINLLNFQEYILYIITCDWLQVSGVKISDVSYQDIQGTSASEIAVKFECSKANPCRKIRLKNVHLSYKNQRARASCSNAAGSAAGRIQPSSCLY